MDMNPFAPALTGRRWAAYVSTWLAYATYYFGRKGIAVTKTSIAEELGGGVLVGSETAFLAAYAAGQYPNGYLSDRFGARRLIVLGMITSAAACFFFGQASVGAIFMALFLVNGVAQATGWPATVKAMAEWTTPERRGGIMGLWATCYQVGGIAATAFATLLLAHFGWRGSFAGCALCLVAVALVVWLCLRPGPNQVQAQARSAAEREADVEAIREARRAVYRSRTLWCFGGAYFFIKLIRYSFLFWLPFYLETQLRYGKAQAGYASTSFEVGGILGTIVLGFLSDRYRGWSRSVWAGGSLVLLAAALLLYAKVSSYGISINVAAMALVGALLFGPDALVSGAAAQDAGGPRGAAIAAGFINGTGSIGAVLQETVTRSVSHHFGWDALFFAFVVFALISAVVLFFAATLGNAGQAP